MPREPRARVDVFAAAPIAVNEGRIRINRRLRTLSDAGEAKKSILKIAQTQPLVVQAILPFRHFQAVKVGVAATVVPEKPFTRSITAQVRTVDRVIDSAAGTFGIVAEITNPPADLPAGIRCKVRLARVGN